MQKKLIQQKLEEIDYPVENLSLGSFDEIGQVTAIKRRDPGTELYNKAGCFFRPNYERGILIYSLIRRFKIENYLEIGFGRGYSAFCAAKGMTDSGMQGAVVTVDPQIDENFLKQLGQMFPPDWFARLNVVRATSDQFFNHLEQNDKEKKYELVYIDGSHQYEQVKRDWENAEKRFTKFVLFDDYHFGNKKEKDMEITPVVDAIEDYEKELIIMDRKLFSEDRKDYEVNYGQVLIIHPDLDTSEYLMDW